MNTLSNDARDLFATAGLDWSDAGLDIRVALLDSSYVFSSGHDNLDDITGVIVDELIVGRTVFGGGVCDGDDVSVSPAAGDTIVKAWVYLDTGVASTSTLLVYLDTNEDGTPLNIPTTGSALPITWSNAGSGIFRL